jgi:hypothetical protein
MKRAGTLRLPARTDAPSGMSGRFYTLPPGVVLPDGVACAARVRRTAREPRPGNADANRTHGKAGVPISGASKAGNARLAPRIDGAFTGTTDEILQWAACKWGLNEEVVRAMAWQESAWRQPAVGRKQTYGILQIKPHAHPGTFPFSRDSTAFNVDYGLAWWRACYEGHFPWVPATAKGDVWGCVGLWFSGRWRDAGAERYIALIKRHARERPWGRE